MDIQLTKSRTCIKIITFACDGGMGSSAVGAAFVRKKALTAGLNVEVSHSSIDEVPEETDLIVTHENFNNLVRRLYPNTLHFPVKSYVHQESYHLLVQFVKEWNTKGAVICEEQILLSCKSRGNKEAITLVGEKMVELGFVTTEYINEMLERERRFSTYIGNGVAIPHGLNYKSKAILKPGIMIAQFPQGVDFNGKKVYLVIGIAGNEQVQVKILSMIAEIIEDEKIVKSITNAKGKEECISIFQKVYDQINYLI